MKIPKTLKIGGHIYKIKMVDSSELEGFVGGVHRFKDNLIKIDKDLADSQKISCFFHELLHAINGNLSEQETEFLAQALTQICIDNKLLT